MGKIDFPAEKRYEASTQGHNKYVGVECLNLEDVGDFRDDGLVGRLDAVVLGHVVDVVAREPLDVEKRLLREHGVHVDTLGYDDGLTLTQKMGTFF
jgi:hypothetical protein